MNPSLDFAAWLWEQVDLFPIINFVLIAGLFHQIKALRDDMRRPK